MNRQEIIHRLESLKDHAVHTPGEDLFFMSLDDGIAVCEAIDLINKQSEAIDALLKVGYPHNFQREEPWIVNYMYAITAVVKKAVRLRNEEVVQDG